MFHAITVVFSSSTAARRRNTTKKAKKKTKTKKKTSRASKRKQADQVVLPQSTATRTAGLAQASVWAVSSEKTQEMILAAEKDVSQDERHALADPATPIPSPKLRRCARDGWGFLRTELARPQDDPDDPHRGWRSVNKRLRHELRVGIPIEELREYEVRLKIKFPPSYWDFSLEWGGGELYCQHTGTVRILPALSLIEEVRGPLCNQMLQPFLPIVDLGCGDYLAMDTRKPGKNKEYPIYWWYGGEPKKKVADSFVQWLKKLVEQSGRPYWWNL